MAGRSARADLVSGQVLVTLPGGVTAPLTDAASIPVGATVDARAGALTLRSAVTAKGSRTQTATVSAGIFALRQRRARARQKVSTDLVLVSPAGAEARCVRRAGRRPPKGVVRGLSVAAKGVFRTVGGAATSAAKGRASWTTTDRCDGTLTRVRKGRVAVLAKGKRRPTVVKAGRTFIVRARLFAARQRP